MLHKKNLFAVLISFLLTLNALIGPLLIFGQGIALVLQTTKLPVTWTVLLTILFSWTLLYICVRAVMNFDQLRKPFGILFMAVILLIPSALLTRVVGFRTVFDSMIYFSFVPIVFIVVMYVVYLSIRKFVDPRWRYLVGSIVFTLLLLIPIFIKGMFMPEIVCTRYPNVPPIQEELLLIITNGKCKMIPGIMNPTIGF